MHQHVLIMASHLTLRVLLLLLPLAACHAGVENRYVNEVESFQSFRMPRSSFSLQRSQQVGVLRPSPVIAEINITSSNQNQPSANEGSELKADITNRDDKDITAHIINQSNRKDVVKNALDDSSTSHLLKAHRRRRRKKRPGVFLLPTALYSGGGPSTSFSRVRGSNFASSTISRSHSSVSSTQHSSTSFTASSLEEGLSTSSTSERLNRTFAAALMKRQYHRFRALLPGGQEVDNGEDINLEKGEASNQGKSVLGRVSAEPSTQHISQTSLSRTVALAENFKQQRSAGESSGASQSGKLPDEWQPFLPSDLLIPSTGRGVIGDQSPEQLESNSTGSVDSITRLLDERLGPGASNNYDPSILVDFLALIALTRPQQQSARSAVRGEQIAGVLTSGRRRGGDVAGRLSQRRVNLLPVTPLRHNLPPFEQILSTDKATSSKDGPTKGSTSSISSSFPTPKEPLAGNGGCGGDADDDKTHCSQLEANQADLFHPLEAGTEEVTPPKLQTIEEQLRLDADLALDAQRGDGTQALTDQELLIEHTDAQVLSKHVDHAHPAEAKTLDIEPMEVTGFESSVHILAQAPEGEVLGGRRVAPVGQTGSEFTPALEDPNDASIPESNASQPLDHGSKEESIIRPQIGRAASRSEASFTDLKEILQRNAVPASPLVGGDIAGLGKEGGPVQVRTVQPSHGDGESWDLKQSSEFGPHSDGNDPDAGLPPPALPPVLRASLYSYLVPRLMALAPLTETIPGVPGLDYPIMSTLPYTNFYCINMPWPGFYADTEARCQAWHLCDLDGRQASFLCPNGTIFNQAFMVCDWWYNSDCQAAPYLYPLNERLFQQPELPPPTQQHRTLTAQVLDTLFL